MKGFRLVINTSRYQLEVKRCKDIIRRKVKERIDNYFYDVIIHISDNYETLEINRLIK